MSALSAICAGPIVTDISAAEQAELRSALSSFMAAPDDYRQSYLQANYGFAFDGYSYHGQPDSTHQAPEDLLHTFVLSDFYPASRYPAEFQAFISNQWSGLSKKVRRIEQALLQEIAPDLVPLHRAGLAHMLSANFYPPAQQFSEPANNHTRLSEHPDVSLFTVFPFGTDTDLQYQAADGRWRAFPRTDNMVVFAGYLLEWLSNGVIPALNHRVALPQQGQAERLSFAVFSLPRPGIQLSPLAHPESAIDAEDYFRRYLSLWDY